MDRVNRSFFVASTLLAIPTALLMVSLSTGTTPEIQLAVGQSDGDGAVRQVVGKQPEPRQTRPGLLQVFSGVKPSGSQNHSHENMPQDEPKGLLDGLFENRSSSRRSSSPTRAKAISRPRTSSNNSESVDWEGIPYHHPNASARSNATAPIRDPGPRTVSDGGSTRIIRGGSSRSVQAIPASSRRPSEPTLARPLAQAVPTPPAVVTPIKSSSTSFSNGTSSRRSNRKSVDALDASEIAAATKTVASSDTVHVEEGSDLVPRVARKDVEAEQSEPEPGPVAGTQETASLPASDSAPETAEAAIGAPEQTKQEPASAGDVAKAAPQTNLAAPTAAPQPAYTTPVDPANSPVPLADVPSQPYAASTPTAPASHRAGPPNDAFGPGQISNSQSQTGPLPHGPPQFNAASAPVGSGVVPNGDVASYRRPGPLQPVEQMEQLPSYPHADPYADQGSLATGRMTTYGQPVATTRPEPAPTKTRPAHETAAVPMHPINGYAPSQEMDASPHAADNFSRSTNESRNQMRDSLGNIQPNQSVVASELPGIRVVTHGPSAIMIRQNSQYEIRVENRGSIDAHGVLIRALVPDWAEIRGQNASRGDIDNQVQGATERLVWTIDHLPAGGSERMLIRLTAARSGTYDLDVDWTLLPQKSISKVQVREPRLDLTIEGPEEVVYGQSQTYKVRVLNPGDGTAPNVVFTLSPNSATPQTQRIGDIPAGKEAQFDVELTAQDLGDLKIHGLASGDLELRAESAKTIRVAAAKLEAVLTGPELKYQNTEAMYSLQIQNNGSATSEKIVATLRMPVGVKYLGGVDDGVVQGNALKWQIHALAPGATRNYQFRCNMTSTGEHLFAFDCNGTAAGNTEVSIATRVESIADLVLSVNDPAAPAPIGSEVTYEIIIRNRGSKEATDVRAVAQFSHGIEPQRIEGLSGEVATGQVLFDVIPRIGAGQEVRMRVIAQADRAGHHRFRTEVRSGDTVLVAEEATHYMSPQSERVSRRSSDAAKR